MAVAKIKINGEWLELYGSEMNGRLKVLENLADVADPNIARENLGLKGDIDTHNHDSRYLPLIDAIQSSGSDISSSVALEKKERTDEDTRIETKFDNEINSLSAAITDIQGNTNNNIDGIRSDIINLENELSEITVTGSTVKTDAFLSSIVSKTYDSEKDTTTTVAERYHTKLGVAGGTYDLKQLIQKLVFLSHSHNITEKTTVTENGCTSSDGCTSNNDCH